MRLAARTLAIAMSLVTAGLVGACTASGRVSVPTTTEAPPEGSATGRHCTPGEVRALVDRFIEDFNAGDTAALQRTWAREGHGFEWYSTAWPGRRIRAAARDRASLGNYFAARHAAGESLHLTSFRFNGEQASYGNFQYTLVRRADDLPATRYTGKGAVVCASDTLGVWSMAPTPA